MKKHVTLLAVLCIAGVTSWYGDSLFTTRSAVTAATSDQRLWLDPVRSLAGLTGRSVMHCPCGECILLHYPPEQLDTGDINEFLRFDVNSPDDDGELYIDPRSRWCMLGDAHKATNTFNCCTYAVGDVAGLTTNDWLAPSGSDSTYYTVPMQVILDSYFEQVQVFKRPIRDWDSVAANAHLLEDDVLCYVQTRGNTPAYSHAGRISKKEGKNWLISKIGTGPIVRATIQAIATEYSDSFDEIWVYRAKKPYASPRQHGV